MKTYHVTYYYYATGMDSPDTRDYGTVLADSEEEAIRIVGKRNYPNAEERTQLWGLTATEEKHNG